MSECEVGTRTPMYIRLRTTDVPPPVTNGRTKTGEPFSKATPCRAALAFKAHHSNPGLALAPQSQVQKPLNQILVRQPGFLCGRSKLFVVGEFGIRIRFEEIELAVVRESVVDSRITL